MYFTKNSGIYVVNAGTTLEIKHEHGWKWSKQAQARHYTPRTPKFTTRTNLRHATLFFLKSLILYILFIVHVLYIYYSAFFICKHFLQMECDKNSYILTQECVLYFNRYKVDFATCFQHQARRQK